jgi:hypothetical protein
MSTAGSQSGDGKTSPFGGGNGGKGAGNGMPGNNFITNPGGNTSGPKHLPDPTVTNRVQPKAKPDVNPNDAAAGGLLPNGKPPAARPGGVGTIGNGVKPFKVG